MVKVGPEIVENWLCCSVSAQRIAFRFIILNFYLFEISIEATKKKKITQTGKVSAQSQNRKESNDTH